MNGKARYVHHEDTKGTKGHEERLDHTMPSRNPSLIVRASLRVPGPDEADLAARALEERLRKWGASYRLTLEPYWKLAGHFILYIRVSGPGNRTVGTLRQIAASLASGDWKFYDEDPEEPFAVWNESDNRAARVPEVSWLCVEIVADHDASAPLGPGV